MLVLALDTTTRAGSIAVAHDDRILAVLEGDARRTHGERLPGEIEAALARASVAAAQLDLLVVSSGPGAFTGLRIGLAAIQGLAMVLGTPVAGVSALEALAETVRLDGGVADGAAIAAWMDAARGEVFAAAYHPGADALDELLAPVVGPPSDLLAALPLAVDAPVVFVGDGALHSRDLIAAARPRARLVQPVPLIAPALARLGRRRALSGAAGPPHTLQPLYVRRPDAELDRERQARA